MSGLVIELQEDALNKKIPVSDLLRKALVVSKKLGVLHIEEWLRKELNGYSSDDNNISSYREIKGHIKVWNPNQGWRQLNFVDPEIEKQLSNSTIIQPVGELEYLIQNEKNDYFEVPFPQKTVNKLIEGMDVPLHPTCHVDPAQVIGILDTVRNNILDFALQLETEGIIGEGISFSSEEKNIAKQINYHIETNIGVMHNSQIQQSLSGSQTLNLVSDLKNLKDFIHRLRSSIIALDINKDSKDELLSEITTIETQTKSPKPKQTIICESLKSVRTILESAVGSVLASGLLSEMTKFFF